MSDTLSLPDGLYELLLTQALAALVPAGRSDVRPLSDDADEVLSRHVANALIRALRAPGMDVRKRVELCNQVLNSIQSFGPTGAVTPGDYIPTAVELLMAIRPASTGLHPSITPARPETPLSDDALLVNAPHEPALAAQLRSEVASADGIDLLCAFITWNGIRTVFPELEAARRRGARIRVITTTYTGITESKALDALTRIGAEIKVSYDTRATRLHAKAWLFERDSGFSTAYIGSSNLTHTALHEGLEWNVRLSAVQSPGLLDRFRTAFETYWADVHFVEYDRERFASAVRREQVDTGIDFTPFEIVPFEYQRSMLDDLEVERERHGRWRNLIVAATGTGKTVVAALDYKRIAAQWGGASLLFVAHRQEILDQSRRLFRHVLRDGSFGELLVGGQRPTEGRHVFASVQSLSHVDLESIDRMGYDVVIIDEFHHAEAPTYRRLLDHLSPRLLLGLTATPERADSKDILHRFDGRIAVELRLWEALDQGLLCPFQYFGVADEVDLADLTWRQGGYDTGALSALYTGNDIRTSKVLQAVDEIVADPGAMRALGFCVSVEHARYMARKFEQAGIRARAITGDTDSVTRAQGIRDLRNRVINIIFAVDVFNEGVDIPEIDTILLLRPTESSTLFLQQLGRGLRLSEGKSGLTVLDFIGQQHREFRFDSRFQALTGIPVRKLESQVEAGFPYLPPGCFVHLDRVSTAIVLENLKANIHTRRDLLVRELRETGDVSLQTYLGETGRSLDDIYRGTRPGWMSLRRSAGLPAPPEMPGEDRLARAIGRMFHIDDDERLRKYQQWLLADRPPRVHDLTQREIRLLNMLHLDLWGRQARSTSLGESLAALWEHAAVREELAQVLAVLADTATSLVYNTGPPDEPLAVHAHYSRDEVLAALGVATPDHPPTMREGVTWAKDAGADAFFITLRKSEKNFSPTTMYRDYALSPREFHWESQSTTSAGSPTGERYINHARLGGRVLLFARETQDQRSFLYLGPAQYVRHSGDRPVAFTWRLERELPPGFFLEARAVS